MAVQLEWHASLPVLVATYTGTLTAKDYYALQETRAAMLDEGPDHVIVIANAQDFENFSDVENIKRDAHILLYDQVYRLLIVFPKKLYQPLSHHIGDTREYSFPVHFFDDADDALAYAKQLARHMPN